MTERKCLVVRLTDTQIKILDARSNAAGFAQRSDYVRYALFRPISTEDKIDRIYKKVVLDAKD